MGIFGKKSDKIAQELRSLETEVSGLSPTQVYVTDKKTNTGKLGDVVPAICGTINLAIENLQQDKPRTAYNLLKALEQEIQRNITQTGVLATIGAVPIDTHQINELKEQIKQLEKIANKIKKDLLYGL
jgi:alanyl-tRNA synthetase